MKIFKLKVILVGLMALLATGAAQADQLDKVIKRGTLNCGVVLDFPPMGYFDKNNKPAGFDVDYCNDLAKALGVKSNVLNLTWGDRIKFQVFSNKKTPIASFDALKNVKVGAALGTTYETEYLAYAKKKGWGKDNYTSFKSENDAFLGLKQGKVDAIISTNTNIATKLQTPEFKDYLAGPYVPNYDDVVGLIAKRSETAWTNYLNLFLIHQIRGGNMNKHYNTHFGSDAPADLIQSLRDNK